MNRADFLDKVGTARRAWEGTIARVPANRLTEPVLAGGWSVKDAIAHVAWSEREVIGVIRERALVGSPLWTLRPNERNAAVFAENRDRPSPRSWPRNERSGPHCCLDWNRSATTI
jgi:hypothetical protein